MGKEARKQQGKRRRCRRAARVERVGRRHGARASRKGALPGGGCKRGPGEKHRRRGAAGASPDEPPGSGGNEQEHGAGERKHQVRSADQGEHKARERDGGAQLRGEARGGAHAQGNCDAREAADAKRRKQLAYEPSARDAGSNACGNAPRCGHAPSNEPLLRGKTPCERLVAGLCFLFGALVVGEPGDDARQALFALARVAQSLEQRVGEDRHRLLALIGVGIERLHEGALGVLRNVGEKLRGRFGALLDKSNGFLGGLCAERRVRAERLVENRGECEEVAALVYVAGGHLLGRHVADGAAVGRGARSAAEPRHAEVGDLYVALAVDEDVGGLDIEVKRLILVGVCQRAADALGYSGELVVGERVAVDLGEKAREAHAVDVLHDDVGVGVIAFEVVKGHDVGVLEVTGGASFGLRGFEVGVRAQRNALDRNAPAQTWVQAELHAAKSALADCLQRPIALEDGRSGGRGALAYGCLRGSLWADGGVLSRRRACRARLLGRLGGIFKERALRLGRGSTCRPRCVVALLCSRALGALLLRRRRCGVCRPYAAYEGAFLGFGYHAGRLAACRLLAVGRGLAGRSGLVLRSSGAARGAHNR